MAKKKRVVITGIGVISPYGVGNKVFWDGIKNGKSGLSRVPRSDPSGFGGRMIGELKGFEISDHLKMKGLRNLAKSAGFALVASKLAIEDGKILYPLKKGLSESCGVVLGTVAGTIGKLLVYHEQILREGPRGVNPFAFPNISPNALASHIAMKFNIKGFNTCVTSEEATGLDALYYATTMLKEYGYKMSLAGSSDSFNKQLLAGFQKQRILAGSLSGTKEISCPYDNRSNGIIASEGCAVFLLEEKEHAVKRKARIYAEITGYGSAFDPKTKNGYSPDAMGAINSMRIAIDDARCGPGDIDYILGTANSKRGVDRTEALAVNRVFAEKTKCVPITSIKGALGSSSGASSSIDVASAVFSLRDGIIPPTINYREKNGACRGLNIVANKPVKKKISRILINAFSAGGFNSSLIIERFKK